MTVKVGEIACFTAVTNTVIAIGQVARHRMSTHYSDILFACLLCRCRGRVDGEERPPSLLR